MADEENLIEQRLSVVRDYLQSRISHCRVLDGAPSAYERTLVVTFGTSGRRTVRVSTALLSNPRVDPHRLAEGLELNDIARKVLATPGFYLDAETVKDPPPR
jgi:hypothetical protein